jgi:hypothetical protein
MAAVGQPQTKTASGAVPEPAPDVPSEADQIAEPQGRKIGIRKPIPLMILDGINLLLVEQLRGRRNASLFAVGDRGGRSTKDPANRRQSLLRQQLLVLKRQKPRPRLKDAGS